VSAEVARTAQNKMGRALISWNVWRKRDVGSRIGHQQNRKKAYAGWWYELSRKPVHRKPGVSVYDAKDNGKTGRREGHETKKTEASECPPVTTGYCG